MPLYPAQGDTTAAIAAYRQAVATLNPIRSNLMSNYRTASTVFRERIQPVYFGLADLLLTQAQQTGKEDKRAVQLVETARQTELNWLREARDTVEILKTAELQDYFEDECTVALQQKQTQLDSIDPGSAIIYPIILPQRLVLLVSIGDRLQQVVTPVAAVDLEATAQRFRRNLQVLANHRYLLEARQLYDWLVRPLETYLDQADVNTLVFVPDGPLRSIPFATLEDGRRFLIERYAVAMTPSLSLTDPQPFRSDDQLSTQERAVLIAGLSEGVQGFSPLPSVPRELRTVQSGARSATASLWFVDDAALMEEFYRQLAGNKLTKARALQNAQLSLLEQNRYRHPIYWGPYLLIGNWL